MIEMLNMDCMEFMKNTPDKAFSLSIVDPPYGVGCGIGERSFNAGYKMPYNGKTWDATRPPPAYFEELMRVSKNQIIWGGNYFADLLPATKCWIFWDKLKAVDNYADGELAWTSFDKNLKKFVYMLNGNVGREAYTIHPTQKPVALYKWLLSRYAKPGDRILDTHGGSGSICIACHDLGYDLTWMELDADYYKAACERYKIHASQAQLFQPEPVKPVPQDLSF